MVSLPTETPTKVIRLLGTDPGQWSLSRAGEGASHSGREGEPPRAATAGEGAMPSKVSLEQKISRRLGHRTS